MTFIDVVFDGPPSHESGRFVEVEAPDGRSIRVGEWIERGNGLWALRIPMEAGSRLANAEKPRPERTLRPWDAVAWRGHRTAWQHGIIVSPKPLHTRMTILYGSEAPATIDVHRSLIERYDANAHGTWNGPAVPPVEMMIEALGRAFQALTLGPVQDLEHNHVRGDPCGEIARARASILCALSFLGEKP